MEYDFVLGITKLIELISLSEKPVLVTIAGGSRSGKSYSAKKLKERIRLKGREISVICLDNYFKDIDDPGLPRNYSGSRLFDVPDSYCQNEFKRHALCLLSGRDVQMPDYDKATNKVLSDQGEIVLASSIVVAEGLFAIKILDGLHASIIKVYMDANENVRLNRRINNDTALYSISKERVEKNFRQKVLPCHERLVAPQKLHADIIINT